MLNADPAPQSPLAASAPDNVPVRSPSTNNATSSANRGDCPRPVAKSTNRQGSRRSAKQSVFALWYESSTVTASPGSTGAPVAGSVPTGRPAGSQLDLLAVADLEPKLPQQGGGRLPGVSEDRGHGAVRGTGEDDRSDLIDTGIPIGEDAGQGGTASHHAGHQRCRRERHQPAPRRDPTAFDDRPRPWLRGWARTDAKCASVSTSMPSAIRCTSVRSSSSFSMVHLFICQKFGEPGAGSCQVGAHSGC